MNRLTDLTRDDFERFPVWEYTNEEQLDELDLQPVTDLPVRTLGNRVVGTEVQLNNGARVWAILGNITLDSRRATEQFITMSFDKGGRWFDLARYHDVDFSRRGPAQLAAFLGLSISEVFPVCYDISSFAVGDPDVLVGQVLGDVAEKLSTAELIRLAISCDAPGH